MKNLLKLFPVLFLLILFISSCSDDPTKYSLEVKVSPPNSGTVTPSSGIFEEGTKVIITGTPAEHYQFIECKEAEVDTLNPFSVIMTSDKTITVVFGLKDSDGDGVTDDIDLEPNTPKGEDVDSDGRTLKTNIPDDNFEQKLIDLGYDDTLDDFVKTSSIKNINSLELYNCSINDLSGIEDFVSLTFLNCSNNQLTSLDISKNTKLTELNCSHNQLTSLDVNKNTALNKLYCRDNQLTSLDISNNTALTYLECVENKLTSLDVSKSTGLTYLNCSANQITSLDVSNNKALTTLYCTSNQLTTLDISNNTALTSLYCIANQLTSLDVNNNTALTALLCNRNQITSLNVSNNIELFDLNCENNQLTNLDISKNTSLKYFRCEQNQITTIIINQNQYENKISSWYKDSGTTWKIAGKTYVPDDNFEQKLIDLGYDDKLDNYVTTSNIDKVTSLYISSLSIKDLSGIEDFVSLKDLGCFGNELTSLDVSKNTALTTLTCSSNQLTNLDLSKNTALTSIDCSYNKLTSLDVTNCTAIYTLYCYNNELTSLDVTKNTGLQYLVCQHNKLTSLDVSKITATLGTFDCRYNQITSIKVNQSQYDNKVAFWHKDSSAIWEVVAD